MDIREELLNLPEETGERLMQAGHEARYDARVLLPGPRQGFNGIRFILQGQVEVIACLPQQNIPVYRYGPGEALGVRGLLRPDSQPKLVWRTVTGVRCLEIDETDILALLKQDTGPLRTMLEHAAHLRDLDIKLAVQPMFRSLPHTVRQLLFERARPVALAPGQLLDSATAPAGSVGMLSYGELKIMRHGTMVATLGSGAVLVDLLGGQDTRIEAGMWSELLLFDPADITDACENYPDFASRLHARQRPDDAT
jgi:CRP-like cAMP-binding protein